MKIKNFRSFGERSVDKEVRFKDGINLIVGENNVGKSNLLRAFELIKIATPQNNDWNLGELQKEITAKLELDLSDKEWKTFTPFKKVEAYLKPYGNRVQIIYSSKDGRTVIQERVSGTERSRSELPKDIGDFVVELLQQKLKNFSEIRKRPTGTLSDVSESYDGGLLADVLAHLKMGNPQERKKFELIKKKFTELFPTLRLEVAQERPQTIPRIVVEKIPTNHEVPIDYVGAGIGEIMILLTHLVASEEMIFGLDMPELHLHPHSQRLLLGILKEHSKTNQILIVTHSPLFVEPNEIDNVIVVREEKGEMLVTQLPEKYFDRNEKTRLQRHLDIHNREFVFSRAALVVEGETELGAMPVFSKALEKDFDKYGISLIRTGKHFDLFIKLLRGLNFPYSVMCDKDALMSIEQSIYIKKKKVRTSPVFYNLSKIGLLHPEHLKTISDVEDEISRIENEVYDDKLFKRLSGIVRSYDIHVLPSDFEGVLGKSGYQNLLEEARTVADSKVIQGRFVAEKILQNKLEVPKEFAEVIAVITNKSMKA